MSTALETIPTANLALALVPVAFVIVILWQWCDDVKTSLYATGRMLLQLLLIGYVLAYVFESNSALIIIAVLCVMALSSSWIALRTVQLPRQALYPKTLLAVGLSGGLMLLLITQGVLNLDPWYRPSYLIPLAGMIFSGGMNAVSLAAERLESELSHGSQFQQARGIALRASLIPIINSLFAVGLVSLPGMMSGQILAGISPFIAARYQIMVMCMLFAAAGFASALFLLLTRTDFIADQQQRQVSNTKQP